MLINNTVWSNLYVGLLVIIVTAGQFVYVIN